MPTSGEDLPEEILDVVVWYVGRNNKGYVSLYTKDVRNVLSTCGQVCRRWARHCRSELFTLIEIDSAKKFLEFRSFLDTRIHGLPPLSQHVRYLYVKINLDDAPFAHLVQIHLRYLSQMFMLEISSIRNCAMLRTSHRLLPAPSASTIGYLFLRDVRLRNAKELSTFIRGFQTLRDLKLANISWDIPPGIGSFSSTKFPATLEYLTCTHSRLQSMWFVPAIIQSHTMAMTLINTYWALSTTYPTP